MTRDASFPPDVEVDPPYGPALLCALLVWALYVITLAPTTAFWDTSEYIATAHIVGIPHPPGNPLFVFVGKAWSLLLAPLGLPVAVRINLLAATTSAAASGFMYLIAHRMLSSFMEEGRFARLAAFFAVIPGATAFTVWHQSNVNEKVYTLSMLIIAAVSWLALLWHDRRNQPGSSRYLLWVVFLLALGSTNHMMSVLPLPGLVVLVLLSGPMRLLRPAFIGRAAALVALGLSFNFVLPLRASLDPVINEGDPTCESFGGAAAAVYASALPDVVSQRLPRCQPLADVLARVQYQTPPITQRNAPIGAQFQMYWQYFDWQWSRGIDPVETPGTARLPFTLLFLGLGALGLWAAWRSGVALFSYLAVLTGTLTLALVVYLNFKHGYSLSPEILEPTLHEVRERDYFFVAGFLVWGCLAGTGLGWLWHSLAGFAKGPRRYAAVSPILAMVLFPLILNWGWASRAGDYAARSWAYDLLMSVEPYAVLFTNGDNDTFPLWYLQEVEGIRKDVTVIVGQYLFTTWYPKQLEALTRPENQRPFDAVVPGLYEERALPASSITTMTGEQMDAVGNARLGEALTVPFPGLAVTYPAETVLNRGHQLALRLIFDSIGERPIYFAAAGGMLSELGLDPWGVRSGLAVQLVPRSLDGPVPAGWGRGSEPYGAVWFDLDHTLRLYEEVYDFRSIRDRPIWQDRSTLNIPLQYYAMALQLADAAESNGRPNEVGQRLREDAALFQLVAEGGLALGG
ncbi:MAG: DUF2723 domain-containing protein [Gemmatimonadota bacterium]|nr:DUF2723 domain-containing protein [Gemmatimonadota bacterium]MDH3422836.1 DUF2723 domain-containing protein [Gemmatimonadota bacterium]